MVPRYREAGLIEPWDTTRIPEFANIYPYMLASPDIQDDTGTWFIPSNFGFTGLAYNPEKVSEADVASLQVFLDPEYAGRISLPASPDDIWSLAFLATGVTDAGMLTDAQFTAAADWLRKAHPSVRSYWTDPSDLAQQMGSGEILLAWSWAEIVPTLKASNFPIAFQRQAKEGTAAWFCGYVKLKDGPGSEDLAYDFINAFLAHGSAETLLDAYSSGHANAAAMAAIDPAKVKEAQLDPVTTPILVNLPSDPAMKDRMLQELERIQAGF
jgi:spermidine/putrescine transport system substrate-binding protein